MRCEVYVNGKYMHSDRHMTYLLCARREKLINCLIRDKPKNVMVRMTAIEDTGWNAIIEDGELHRLECLC
jgi:hypothetical protein